MSRPAITEGHVFGVTLGCVVAQLRERRGMRQADLAAHLGLSQPLLSRIEAGKRQPDAHLFGRMVCALGMTAAGLLKHVEDAMARTASVIEAATAATAATPAEAWGRAVAVAGVDGLAALIAFTVAAELRAAGEAEK